MAQHPHVLVIHGQPRHLGGWKRDTPDHRDQHFMAIAPPMALPPAADVSGFDSPVEDQGNIGSCTAHASTSAMEALYRILKRPTVLQLSRLFVYYQTRVQYERVSPHDDSGCEIRNVIKALAKCGTCQETLWPYTNPEQQFAVAPPQTCVVDALNHQILTYYRLTGLRQLQQCLASGYPVIGGFSVPESAMNDHVAQDGIVHFPQPSEAFVGGHAVEFVGYDNRTRLVKFKNSWSPAWGQKGYGFLPYDFFTDGLADDCWTIRNEEL